MPQLSPEQIRESFLIFFEERGHTRYPSDGLVPENDPTLLFTGAGMNQFKAMFLGKGTLPFSRATTVQKCMRMPDLENVGRTPSHHTFFEMLGNFSFGDYFKQDAIVWAWELLAQWGMPPERLSVTVYKDDDEAEAIWRDVAGVPQERIFREDEADNFWPAAAPSQGPNGICGPCSEIYFDLHPERGPMPPEGPTVDGERFVEIWNLVFTQYDRRDGGHLEPLPQRNIDTGMGFERAVRVLESLAQGRTLPSNFDTTLFAPIMDAIHSHVGREAAFGTPEGIHARRLADHIRAATFCIADGVRPSNLKQGYVVRKVLRRAMVDRHMLGGDLRKPWLADLSRTVVTAMGAAWPELGEAVGMIASTIAAEEEKFAAAFLSGSQRLEVIASRVGDEGGRQLPGHEAFLLYDTFGLPLDLQQMLLEEHGLTVDEQAYQAAMAAQRRRSREASRMSGDVIGGLLARLGRPLPQSEFVRDRLVLDDATILDVVADGPDEAADESAPDEDAVLVVLDKTPFYAEGGGQVGDAGTISGEGFRIDVIDTVNLQGVHVHRGIVAEGRPVRGPCTAAVEPIGRAATARNHTATHLLHAALRSVLGEDVSQAGSLVEPDRLRFDFRFGRALTETEVRAVEDLVGDWILQNTPVQTETMGREQARERGAMALFGEKYGDRVRVVSVAGTTGVAGTSTVPDSVELCGGTHVARSGDIGLLRIVSESSIAAGVRRIEALTGRGLLAHVRDEAMRLHRAAGLFKAAPEQLEERVEAVLAEVKSTRRALEDLRGTLARDQLARGRRQWNGMDVLVAAPTGVPMKSLRESATQALKQGADLVLLAAPEGSGTGFMAAAGPRAQELGLRADVLVRALARALDGKGGGNAALAQGRGGVQEDLQAVLQEVLEGAGAARP